MSTRFAFLLLLIRIPSTRANKKAPNEYLHRENLWLDMESDDEHLVSQLQIAGTRRGDDCKTEQCVTDRTLFARCIRTQMRPDMHRDVVLKVHVVLHDDGLHLRSAGEGDRLQTSHIPHIDLVSGRKAGGQESRILHPNLGNSGMGVDFRLYRPCWIFRLQDSWLHFLALEATLRLGLAWLRAWDLI